MGKTKNRLVAVMALTALAGSAVPLQAQQLLRYTDTVRYNYTDNLNGVGWNARVYTEGANWGSGAAVLSTDGALTGVQVRTSLPDPRTFSPQGHATYFRAHFSYTGPSAAILTLTNRIDDGAVFYVNGAEIGRVRVNAGTVTFTSFANNQPPGGDANADDVFEGIATNLVSGDNVLAVMVLQVNATSSDITCGTEMGVVSYITPVNITQQPQSQTAQVNDSVTFNVTATGNALQYQWQFNGNNIAFATNSSYTVTSVQTASAGSYRVIVSNPLGSATSLPATLTVTSDTTPPQVVSAVAQDGTQFILIRFDERVLNSTATDKNNYTIRTVGNTNVQLVVSNAQVNANLVRLTVQPWVPGSSYILYISGVADLNGYVIAPGTPVGISFWQSDILPDVAVWNWSSGGYDLGSQNWFAYNYNEYTNDYDFGGQWNIWKPDFGSIGTTAFYYSIQYSTTYQQNGATLNTTLDIGWPCYYFRTRFVVTNTTPQTTVRFRYFVDDGAVIYFNGVEMFRYNMRAAPTPITFNTLANSVLAPPSVRWTTVEMDVTNMVSGTNVIAAEMHPGSLVNTTEEGIIFQLGMDAAVAPAVPPPSNTPRPDVRVLVSGSPNPVNTNTAASFTMTVTNAGAGAATSIQAISTFPAGVNILSVPAGCVNAAGTVTCTIGTIGAGQAVSRVIQVASSTLGPLTNVVNVPVRPEDLNMLNNSGTNFVVVTNLVSAGPDIAVTASAIPSVTGINSDINFSFIVTNNGTTSATSVRATNTLPAGVTVVTVPAGCVNASGVVSCDIGTIAGRQSASRTIVARSPATGSLTNKVVVSSTPADSNTANNQATAVVSVTSGPSIGNVKIQGGNFSFTFQSQAGVSYVVEYKDALNAPAWTTVTTLTGTGAVLTYSVPTPVPPVPTRFYRLRAQ